ncbi:MAG TPA: hypothetical protein VM925_35740 [Labilithrix sp.]|nr:hypothetical protein [Labilithrix sp.]
MRLARALVGASVFVAGGLVLTMPSVAHAGIEACGNIDVKANATCKVEVEGGCTAQCEPVRFEASCAAKLETQCQGQCSASATVDCQASCKGSCTGQCEANPGSLDCSASCRASCEGDCSGKCSSSGNKSECEASCKATCSGSCDAECTGTPPSATCDAKCEASCKGSCKAEANVDCQISCQSKGYAQCKANLQGGCTARCEKPEGALFCDGQYVDTGDNLKNCIAALDAYLNVKVDASGSASCDNGTCEAKGEASASCNASPTEAPASSAWLLAGLGTVIGVAARRRKRA